MAKQKIDLTNENQNIFKVIIWLAWPLFLEQILSTLVSFVDTARWALWAQPPRRLFPFPIPLFF